MTFNNEPRVTSRRNLQSSYAPLLHAKRVWSLAKKAYKLVAQMVPPTESDAFKDELSKARTEHKQVWTKLVEHEADEMFPPGPARI